VFVGSFNGSGCCLSGGTAFKIDHVVGLWKLVRKLGANSQPGEQAQALDVIWKACDEDDCHFLAAIVAVGVIPLLVPLLGPGSPAEVQELASKYTGGPRFEY
jgi:hypothetical protein